jgi:putative ABC transport system permease protein
LWKLVVRNLLRNKTRAALTVVGMAVAVVAFVLLRTIVESWNAAADHAAKDRLSTRNRVSFGLPLPKRYIEDIAKVPGVKSTTHCDWFGARWPRAPNEFFANLACADDAFAVYPEIGIDPAALLRWKSDRKGAIVGDLLAKKFGWHIGDRITLEGTFYPGDWELTIDGIYTVPARSALDRATLFFRWDYKNDGVPERDRNTIGWIFTRVDEPSKSSAVSRAIDDLFAERDVQTLTMSERAANLSMLGAAGTVLRAIDVVSCIVLGIMMLLLGNTIAMGVRERTTEFAVLRVLGFGRKHIQAFVVGEALGLSLLAVVVGLALAFPIVDFGIGRILEENMGKFFPSFRMTPRTVLTAFTLTLCGGVLSAVVPAARAGRMQPAEAIRRVD